MGSIVANQFISLRESRVDDAAIVVLDELTMLRLVPPYIRAVRDLLRTLLQTSEIRLRDEAFLFEGQYYTEVYYLVARALASPDVTRLASDWLLASLDTDVLIAHSLSLIHI